jgi:hypothetical protein
LPVKTAELDPLERDIAERAASAGLHLRFDKVALRVVTTLRARVKDVLPERQVLLLTVTAPIRQPAETIAALETLVRRGLSSDDAMLAIYGNGVRLRVIRGIPEHVPRLLGFVHNPGSDPETLLAIVETRIRAV